MADINDISKDYQLQKEQRRQNALAAFVEDSKIAKHLDMELIQKTDSHYQLKVSLNKTHNTYWLFNLYPGNQRIYSDPNHRGPFLKMPDVDIWTFENIIVAADKAREKTRK